MSYNISTELAYFGSWAIVIAGSVLTVLFAIRILRRRRALMRALMGAPLPGEEDILPLIRKYAHFEKHPAGTVLFDMGDAPDRMFVIESGTVSLPDVGKRMGAGEILGELGVFTPQAARTSRAVCETECTTHTLPYDSMLGLYEKHPRFSLQLMRLIVDRLTQGQTQARA